jgi:hypothetical protein
MSRARAPGSGSATVFFHREAIPAFLFNRARTSQQPQPRDAPVAGWSRSRLQPPRRLGLEPVSADTRTCLCSRPRIPPGNGLARPETGTAFLATLADSWRQRPRCPASPAAKPGKSKTIPTAPGNGSCAGLRGGPGGPDRTGLRRHLPANREFSEFVGEKQASDEFLAAGASQFDHCLSRLDPHPSRFLLLRKTGGLSVKTGDLNRNIRHLQAPNR